MTKEDFIRFCRYYKGEDECPFNCAPNVSLWYWEQTWVEMNIRRDKLLVDLIDEYLRAGLGEFEHTDDTPASLKALLFNRYYHWNEGGDFKRWYKESYVANKEVTCTRLR